MRRRAPVAARHDSRRDHIRALVKLSGDVLVPLVSYYGLRLLGADAWLSLVVSGAVSLVAVSVGLIVRRRVDRVVLFSLSLLTLGTVIGLISADPRAMMARGSWLTAAAGVWIIASSLGTRPLVYTATLALMPASAAADWRAQWARDAAFRRVLRRMTLAFGTAFLVDAAVRAVLAYTLPLDAVPVLANLLLVGMLTLIVVVGKWHGGRAVQRVSGAADEPAGRP